MTRIKRKFDQEFKIQAIKLVIEQGYQIKEAAENLGIGTSTLGKWVRKYRSNTDSAITGKIKRSPEGEELNRLRKEITKLKQERAILKKALGYFAEEQR